MTPSSRELRAQLAASLAERARQTLAVLGEELPKIAHLYQALEDTVSRAEAIEAAQGDDPVYPLCVREIVEGLLTDRSRRVLEDLWALATATPDLPDGAPFDADRFPFLGATGERATGESAGGGQA